MKKLKKYVLFVVVFIIYIFACYGAGNGIAALFGKTIDWVNEHC